VIILVSFFIAGCSVAGVLRDRKRPFSLLTGTQLGVLRRVVLLESTVPVAVVAVAAIGEGFLAARLFVQAQFSHSIRTPGIRTKATSASGTSFSRIRSLSRVARWPMARAS